MGLFQTFRISTARQGDRLKIGDRIVVDPDTRIEKYGHVLEGRVMPLALGAFSYSHSPFNGDMTLGRYCSVSFGVEVIRGDHPMDWVTTSPITHLPLDVRGLAVYLNDIGQRDYGLYPIPQAPGPATLGHDVWLGMRVLIKRGVRIGHGAIVGAGSVVTRDVPPYAIVAGSPARIIRYRFAEPVIERLLRSEWWNYGPERLQSLDLRDPEQFLDAFDRALADGMPPLTLPVLTGEAIIAASKPERPASAAPDPA